MKTLLIVAGAGAAVFLLVVVLIIGYLGFMPIISDLMGTNRPRDLGVDYTEADYESGLEKIPGLTVENVEDLCITCDYESKGSVPVRDIFTEEEFTAQMNKRNQKGPASDIQVKFNADGSVETSMMITDPRLTGPVYGKGVLDTVKEREVTFDLQYMEVGRLGMGGGETDTGEEVVNDIVADFFNDNPGLSVDTIKVREGEVAFEGTHPEEIVGDPGSEPGPLPV